MSGDKLESAEPGNYQNHSTSPDRTADRHGLSRTDWRLDQLKNIIAPAPYILDLRQSQRPKNERRPSREWRYSWHNGHPFEPSEESLQYLSFFSHLEWEDSVLLPIGNWDDGKGKILIEDPTKVEKYPSWPGTPILGASGARKKVSMKEYLDRKNRSDESRPASQQSMSSSAAEEEKMEKKLDQQPEKVEKDTASIEMPKVFAPKPKELPQVNGSEQKLPTPQPTKKRPLESSDGADNGLSTANSDSRRPEKKQRLTPATEESRPKKSPQVKAAMPDLPRELSPTLPPSLSADLPGMLSPTLPPAIEEALKDLPALTNGSTSHKKTDSVNSVRSEGKKTSTMAQVLQEKSAISPKPQSTTPRPVNGIKEATKSTQSPSMTASKSEKSKPHRPTDSDVVQKSAVSNGLKPSSSQELDRQKDPTKPAKKEKRIIRLKYGKKNRTGVRRILGMKPQPKKTVEDAASKKLRDEESRNQKEKVRDEESKSLKEKLQRVEQKAENKVKSPLPRSEKRPRPVEEDEPSQSSKRTKLPPNLNLEKPRTPVPAAFKSPAPSKSQFNTPRKDLKSVAMRRVDSGDGDVRTPSGLRSGTPTAPNSIERGSGAKASPPNTTSNADVRQEKKGLWRAQSEKYSDHGRSLKHQADKLLKARTSEDEIKLGVVLAIESMLCYMIAFFGWDEANTIATGKPPYDSHVWQTIIPYYDFVRHNIDDSPELRGLVLQIGALCCETVHTIDMERLLHDPLPKTSGDGISPPSDPGNMTPNTAKATKYHQDYLNFKKATVSAFHKARGLWLEAARDFPLKKIKQDYPQTWAKQETDAIMKGRVKYAPGKFDGAFFLPLGGTSSPMEIVSFGKSFLAEWCAKEKVKWEPKIGS